MALSNVGKKGTFSNLTRALASATSGNVRASISSHAILDRERTIPGSIRCLRDIYKIPSCGADLLANRSLIRGFHASMELLNRRKDREVPFGLKTTRKGKFSKRPSERKAPAEAPYVPPPQKKNSISMPDKPIEIFEGMTLLELAKRAGKSISALQVVLGNLGENVSSEFDPLSIDVAELIAMDVGVNVKRLHSDEGSDIQPRPAVVTVMGHVDHGKTSLLDALRQTSVAAKEAGGITQHLGAFIVGMPSGASITFLDTPGHAAFSAMRARGAAVTDIVVLVVAADDGVMPQTSEAITHAKSANVQIVVAINKCDKPGANPESVKIQLAREDLLLEEMGGEIQVVEVSALNKTGLDKLEEALLLQAEIMDLKARVDGPAQAYVVEARLDRGRGPLATAIIKEGTLVSGKHVVVGAEWGKIRAIRDTVGKLVDKAGPATPVVIEGLKGLPMAGDEITVVETEERARMLSAGRKKKVEKDRLTKIEQERLTKIEQESLKKLEEESSETPDEEEVIQRAELSIIIKADVQGSAQAVTDALRSLNSPQVLVNIVHVGVGPISQSDVDLAQACDACIVGFNVRNPPSSVSMSASRANIEIKVHNVIYHLLNEMGNLIVEKAPGTSEMKVAGEAQVLNIFEIKGRSKAKGDDFKIAGCKVVDGHVSKSATLRLLRSGEIVFEGSCTSLKKEKQDVEMVGKGNECGLVIQNCLDFRIGDVVQCIEKIKRKPKFISSESGAVRIEC